eukprot:5607897-Lingulodinium_polyedra.AAC.1
MPATCEVPFGNGQLAFHLPRWGDPVGAVRRPHRRLVLGGLRQQKLAGAHGPPDAGTPRVAPLR